MTTTEIDSLTAGQTVKCTVTKLPKAEGAKKTIARLMRRDPANLRGLRRAQELRSKRMNRYIRGHRLRTSRENASRVVRVFPGENWSMPFTFDIAPDLKSVSDYLSIEKA